MIYQREYVKALIRKKVLHKLSAAEWAEYQASQQIYSDEEFDEMFAETLLEMGDELPAKPLGGWKPDFNRIAKGDCLPKKRRKWQWQQVAAACVIVGIVAFWAIHFYQGRQQSYHFQDGPCAGLTSDAEILLTESVVSLRWGDTIRRNIAGNEHGLLLREGNMEVFKTEQGMFQLKRRKGHAIGGVILETQAQQQALVELPDGTRIRLNAQSSLQYVPERTKMKQIKVQGEAYVERLPSRLMDSLVIATHNGFVSSRAADFALLSLQQVTRVAVLSGELTLHSSRTKKTLQLNCYGAQGTVARFINTMDGEEKDSLQYGVRKDPDMLLNWTKAVRHYQDIPLREFVGQMSRWYGFQVKDYSCLPVDKRITTTVCYRKDREAVFAAIREAGVLLYETKGMISFCPEDVKKTVKSEGRLAWRDWK